MFSRQVLIKMSHLSRELRFTSASALKTEQGYLIIVSKVTQ